MSAFLHDIVALETADGRLEVAPALGGGIVRYIAQEHDWLRPATPAGLAEGGALGLACFPLVPYSNRIRDGRFAFEGRRVDLPSLSGHALHGHGWKAPWSVTHEEEGRLSLEYRHLPDDWPFAYVARQTFALEDERLRIMIEITSESAHAMPCGLGLHPYFARTGGCRLKARVEAMWETDGHTLPTRLVPATAFSPGHALLPDRLALDNAFTGWSGEATIEWPEWGRRLLMTASPPLRFLVVYSPPGADYFCAEPVSNCTDAFNLAAQGHADSGTIVLAPGQSVKAEVTFRPSFG